MTLGLHTAELNFSFENEIGQEGRNSTVYRANDIQLSKLIAVKKIKKADITEPNEYYEESKKLSISEHSNIVKVMYGCSDEDHIYIAMPFYRNGSLKARAEKSPLTIREIIRYCIQFLSGVHHIHSKNLLHCDIKPDNILLSDSNEALLSDFGLAKFMDEYGLAEQNMVYEKQVPPEVLSGGDRTVHYDVYLCGLTMYRLFNGEQHFYTQFQNKSKSLDEYKEAIRTGLFPDRNNYLLHIPKKLQTIINKALSVDIEDRYQNILELINALSSVEDHLDWIYEKGDTFDKWTKRENATTIEVSLCYEDGFYDIVTKKSKGNSPLRKVRDHCHTHIRTYKKELMRALKL